MRVKRRTVLLRAGTVAVLSVLAFGCAKKVQLTAADAPAGSRMANIESKYEALAMSPKEQSAVRTLAYEHTMSVEIAKELLAARIEAVEDACKAAKDACTLLETANYQQNGVPAGRVRLRLAPGEVGTLRKVASEGGVVTNSNTSAEDLAQPIADTERQLSLLNLHRQRLTEFMSRKDMKVADLITVSRELATVQSQIDDFGNQRANLRRRVDTELLTIEWSPPVAAYQSAQSPVIDALKSFGANFKEAIAQVITFVSFVLPWIVVAVPGLFAVRWLWNKVNVWILGRRKAAA